MGNIFCRKRQITEELEEIVTCITDLEKQVQNYVKNRSSLLRVLIYLCVVFFAVLTSYIWLHYSQILRRTFAIIVAFIFTILIYFMLRLTLISAYDFLILQKRKKIQFYVERKIKLIEDVKENEKFKVAKEIIEKYSTKEDLTQFDARNDLLMQSDVKNFDLPFNENKPKKNSKNCFKKMSRTMPSQSPLLMSKNTEIATNSIEHLHKFQIPKLHEMKHSRYAQKPIRPFIEPSKNFIDRVLDYVLGETINNRYALICQQCQTHNGMALQEEFEQISFFCYKCISYNPSRNENKTALSVLLDQETSSIIPLSNNAAFNLNKTKSFCTSNTSLITVNANDKKTFSKSGASSVAPSSVSTDAESIDSLAEDKEKLNFN